MLLAWLDLFMHEASVLPRGPQGPAILHGVYLLEKGLSPVLFKLHITAVSAALLDFTNNRSTL